MHYPKLLSLFTCFILLIAFLFSSACSKDDNTNPQPDIEIPFTSIVTISANSTSLEEEQDVELIVTISLSESNSTSENVIINYTIGGTASADSDFTGGSQGVSIEPNSTSASFNLTIVDDTDEELGETIIVTISNSLPDGLSIGSPSSVTATIEANDQITGIGDDECPNDNSLSTINAGCDQDIRTDGIYNESVANNIRTINTNTLPNHRYSAKFEMEGFDYNFKMTVNPTIATSQTSVIGQTGRPQQYFGVALNGVVIAPAPATPFIFENTDTGEYNWDWVFEPTNNQGEGRNLVALDCSSAHVGPQGYHYHGNMFEYVETIQTGLSADIKPTAPVQVGWASDGFPILYIYGPDASGNLVKLEPSYQTKSGNRPGDGVSAPCGSYNGKYTNDYEYIDGNGDLDACNGIERNITLNTSVGSETFSYFYVITEAFPQIPRCLSGAPDSSFDN